MFTISDLFNLDGFEHAEVFRRCEQPWDPLEGLSRYLVTYLSLWTGRRICGVVDPTARVDADVIIADGAVVEPTAFVTGPTVIGPGTIVRHGAYVRGGVLTGRGCVIGHATEVKHAIFLDRAKAPHFNYVGDSILGKDVNLGAGVKLANLKLSDRPVVVDGIATGLRKLGAILGDDVQVGCNAVLSPGTILAPGAWVMANATVPAGCHAARSPALDG